MPNTVTAMIKPFSGRPNWSPCSTCCQPKYSGCRVSTAAASTVMNVKTATIQIEAVSMWRYEPASSTTSVTAVSATTQMPTGTAGTSKVMTCATPAYIAPISDSDSTIIKPQVHTIQLTLRTR